MNSVNSSRFFLPNTLLSDPDHAVCSNGGTVVDEGVPLLGIADDGHAQVALAVPHHADHAVPEAGVGVQAAPLVVTVHVPGEEDGQARDQDSQLLHGAYLVFVQEQLQDCPLQSVDSGLAPSQVEVGHTLIVESDTYLSLFLLGTASGRSTESEALEVVGVGAGWAGVDQCL